MTRKQKSHDTSRHRIAGVLDIGSTKTVCMIGTIDRRAKTDTDPPGALRVAGIAQQRSQGITNGVVTDLDRAEQVVRATIAEAEAMAGVTLDDIAVSVSTGQLASQNFRTKLAVASGTVTQNDVTRVLAAGRRHASRDGRTLIHLAHRGFVLDGADAVSDPRGLTAKSITTDWHGVSADPAALNNLLMLVERCYLRTSHMFVASYASGLATTTEEERQLGVTCIDFGGGTTTLSVFQDSEFIFQESLAVGSNNITIDIARTLQSPLAEAERIKALYGSVIRAHSDSYERFTFPLVGDEDGEPADASKAELSDIVRQGFEGLVRRIEQRLSASGVAPYAGNQVVITGGGSQLTGASTYLSEALGKRVRVASPRQVPGLPQLYTSPAFSTAAGLLHARARVMAAARASRQAEGQQPSGYIQRVGEWLKSGF